MKFYQYTSTLLIIALLSVVIACSDGTGERVPLKGEVTYDISYSDDITKSSEFGTFLPHTVKGLYDTTNIKLVINAPMGLVNVSCVVSNVEDFVAVDFDNAKLLLTMSELLDLDDAKVIAENLKITEFPGSTLIAGYTSQHVCITPDLADQEETRIDVFFVPFHERPEGNITIADLFRAKLEKRGSSPGVVTALNIRMGESNIMLRATKIESNEKVSTKDFERPGGHILASRKDLMSMVDIMLN